MPREKPRRPSKPKKPKRLYEDTYRCMCCKKIYPLRMMKTLRCCKECHDKINRVDNNE